MKKSSRGFGIGLWVVGGLVVPYVVGGVAIQFDRRNGSPILGHAPPFVVDSLEAIYGPVFVFLYVNCPWLFPIPR